MKIINVMNFVRQTEPRSQENCHPVLFDTTRRQLEMLNEYKIDNTFLLQYDALCDPAYRKLFREEATEHTELGLWYEIVAPLTYACGIPYESERGWMWDWHIKPGFSMSYSDSDREKLIDEAMRKFKEVFGHYPRTVGGWIIDTHTVNYLNDHYEIDCIAICRDQTNTDAYTLVGGYFNQAYYPSRSNMFTPSQTDAYRNRTPIFRLLGPCPNYNYDRTRFMSAEGVATGGCCTLESVWYTGYTPSCVEWFFKTYFRNPDLGFSYAQIGQENSFGMSRDVVEPLRMQIDLATKMGDVEFRKMGDTGRAFKTAYPDGTPATAVTGLDNWDAEDVQSVYYDCKNYVANLFRFRDKLFIRALYLFDETIPDRYEGVECTTFDAVYENMPIVDTVIWAKDKRDGIGIVLDTAAVPFSAEQTGEGELTVKWGEKKVVFTEKGILLDKVGTATYDPIAPKAEITLRDNSLRFLYRGYRYSLATEGATVTDPDGIFTFRGDKMTLLPAKES